MRCPIAPQAQAGDGTQKLIATTKVVNLRMASGYQERLSATRAAAPEQLRPLRGRTKSSAHANTGQPLRFISSLAAVNQLADAVEARSEKPSCTQIEETERALRSRNESLVNHIKPIGVSTQLCSDLYSLAEPDGGPEQRRVEARHLHPFPVQRRLTERPMIRGSL